MYRVLFDLTWLNVLITENINKEMRFNKKKRNLKARDSRNLWRKKEKSPDFLKGTVQYFFYFCIF